MGLFRSKKSEKYTATPIIVTDSPIKDPIVEIIANRRATEEVVEQAKKASKQLNEVLVQNGFTIKIYLAAGGHLPNKKKAKK